MNELTYAVKTIATTRMAYPALYGDNSCRRCLVTTMQKMMTGTMINDKVTRSDLASGPNINLPPRINSCRKEKGAQCHKYTWIMNTI